MSYIWVMLQKQISCSQIMCTIQPPTPHSRHTTGSVLLQFRHKAVKQELSEQVELQHNKYLNNLVERDQQGIKRLVKPGIGFGFFNVAAWVQQFVLDLKQSFLNNSRTFARRSYEFLSLIYGYSWNKAKICSLGNYRCDRRA